MGSTTKIPAACAPEIIESGICVACGKESRYLQAAYICRACLETVPSHAQVVIGQIVQTLKADPRRDIYISAQNDYWITYQGGGPWPADAVRQMVSAGLLKQKWPDVECYILAEKML